MIFKLEIDRNLSSTGQSEVSIFEDFYSFRYHDMDIFISWREPQQITQDQDPFAENKEIRSCQIDVRTGFSSKKQSMK